MHSIMWEFYITWRKEADVSYSLQVKAAVTRMYEGGFVSHSLQVKAAVTRVYEGEGDLEVLM